jgi:hypothetical protein
MVKIKDDNKLSLEKPTRVEREINYELKEKIIHMFKEKKSNNSKYSQINLIEDLYPIVGYRLPPTTLSRKSTFN